MENFEKAGYTASHEDLLNSQYRIVPAFPNREDSPLVVIKVVEGKITRMALFNGVIWWEEDFGEAIFRPPTVEEREKIQALWGSLPSIYDVERKNFRGRQEIIHD